ncbi:MAG TPA: hypothetical protein VEB21_08645 [Terriglobales bacterium]|nr:hypothetical protein [Terriglobales bacterium]
MAGGQTSWVPITLGVGASLLGMVLLRELLIVPSAQGEFLLLGTLLTGSAAWFAAATQVLLLFLMAYGAFTHRRAAVWLLIGYCLYWIASVWVWSWMYLTQSVMTRTVTSALVTVLLLVICRTAFVHREDFHQ